MLRKQYDLFETVYTGNSVVFKGKRVIDGLSVAVKRVPLEDGTRERDVLNKLHSPKRHPHIIELLDHIVSDDGVYVFGVSMG